jgi:staphylococcal nuclease domain-containing protein 1
VDYKEGNLQLLHLRLIDPADPSSRNGDVSINADLVREGYCSVDRKGVPAKYMASYPAIMRQLGDCTKEAKRERAGRFIFCPPFSKAYRYPGMFEFGDVEEDD